MSKTPSKKTNRVRLGLRTRIAAAVGIVAVLMGVAGTLLAQRTLTEAIDYAKYREGMHVNAVALREVVLRTAPSDDPKQFLNGARAVISNTHTITPPVWRLTLIQDDGIPALVAESQPQEAVRALRPVAHRLDNGFAATYRGPRSTPTTPNESGTPSVDGVEMTGPYVGPDRYSATYTSYAPIKSGAWELRLETTGYPGLWDIRAVELWVGTAIVTAIIVSLACLAAWWWAGLITRPLRQLADSAKAIREGDLARRVDVKGRDETAHLATEFNAMTDRLVDAKVEAERANEQQKQFVADLAHELRTPTFALLSAATALENPETRDQASALVAPQLRRLSQLSEDMMMLAKLDAGQAPLHCDEVNLVDVIAFELHANPDVVWEMSAPPVVAAEVDVARVRMIVRNLVTNAIRHGREPFTCRIQEAGGLISFSITDGGDPIPEALRPKIFERFIQGDQSRTGEGSGLGLAIARENARAHGGDLVLGSDGKTFTCTLPATPTT